MLDRVRQPLASDEVSSRLDLGSHSLARNVYFDGYGSPFGKGSKRGAEAVIELGRPYPARQLSQLGYRYSYLGYGLIQGLGRTLGCRAQLVLRVAKGEADADESLLGPIVEVPLDASTLLVTGSHDARARCLDGVELATQFHS